MSIATGRIQTIMALVSKGATFIPIVSIARGAIQTSLLMSGKIIRVTSGIERSTVHGSFIHTCTL